MPKTGESWFKKIWQISVAMLPTASFFPSHPELRSPTRGQSKACCCDFHFPFSHINLHYTPSSRTPHLLSFPSLKIPSTPFIRRTKPPWSLSPQLLFPDKAHTYKISSHKSLNQKNFSSSPHLPFPQTFLNTPNILGREKKRRKEKRGREKKKKQGKQSHSLSVTTYQPRSYHYSVNHRLHRYRCPLALAWRLGSLGTNLKFLCGIRRSRSC